MTPLESWILCLAWFLAGMGAGAALAMCWFLRKLKKVVLYLEGYYQRHQPKPPEVIPEQDFKNAGYASEEAYRREVEHR
jgi:hypothetical protein